ncbi:MULTISPECIES: HesA/MoeB/ThiF family protein [Pectobacterium]|uniref:HesA/MoeB/ThiF family protein n=1 Tax=Pectobacterium TaxID=122277 RepID=UPI001F080E2B|nr:MULTISPECIES: ThiF family adenylyltransferase [Pectobacterium]
MILNKKFHLKRTIDVYASELEDNKIKITFHRMTTREKIEIVTSKSIAEFLALLDGKNTAYDIFTNLGAFKKQDAITIIDFLLSRHLITEQDENADSSSRYARQIAYLDDMVLDRTGYETQGILSSKSVAILGCGAVTGHIAEYLVRAGVLNITLVDDKEFKKQNLSRHLFSRVQDVGKPKVDVLANYLKQIDSRCRITIFKEKLLPNTDLSKWISDDIDLVINGCDEPYIGHTSLKLGRHLQSRSIPLYVMGGFDAHLMSSGELVYPPKTPCIDCIQNTFSKALSEWKPVYNRIDDIEPLVKNIKSNSKKISYDIGGSGGLAIMSGFSASFSCLKIIQFLAQDSQYNFTTIRYEYLPNNGELTEFRLLKQEGCHVCGK